MKNPFKLFSKNDVCKPLTNIQGRHVKKYRSFKTFLGHNHAALNSMAALEQRYHSGRPFSLAQVKINYEELLEAAFGVLYSLESLAAGTFPALESALRDIDAAISGELEPSYTVSTRDLVLPFEQLTPERENSVGAKAAHLARIKNQLGLPVPHGFVVTAHAFQRFMMENDLALPVARKLARISLDSLGEMEKVCAEIQKMVAGASVPEDLADEILKAYSLLEGKTFQGAPIAMRSSAVGEDTEATFAGQYTTVLNVTKGHVLDAYRTVLAGKYSAKAVSSLMRYGLDDRETPMCVAGIVMVDARSSGVMYTADPSSGNTDIIKIHSLWGLGEHLVDGSASPDTFLVDRKRHAIIRRELSRKENRLIIRKNGGTKLETVSDSEKNLSSISDDEIAKLAEYGRKLEELFEGPQDIEWALDKQGILFILQSRPLRLPAVAAVAADRNDFKPDPDRNPVLLTGGRPASPGIAAGNVFILPEGPDMRTVPEGCIVVAKTASPDHAKLIGRINGIITEIGSTTSHLASVAREFGVPAVFDMKNAASRLHDNDPVTLDASHTVVYQGIVDGPAGEIQLRKKPSLESPVLRRTRRVLDRISPLNLTDPGQPSFSPERCRTVHDIIRYTHEQAMKEMFGLTEEADEVRSVRLTAKIPLILHLIDLGNGLRHGLTTCHTVTPEDIESIPMKALWKGFTHPGITWEGTINFDTKSIMTLLAASATSEFGQQPGGTSYAILSADYTNLSAKFGYHFATIDALCGENSSQNYVSLQFAGGAGSYYGKSLRIALLGSILKRLGFQVTLKGDLIEAFIAGYDKSSTEDKLDQMGRLLASSRLLDMALSNQHDIEVYTDAFFREDYDFLSARKGDALKNFYTHGGWWKRSVEDGRVFLLQDGARSGLRISSGVAGIMGKLAGKALQDFLDNIEAYYCFPLAIAKNSELSDGSVSARVKPVSGHIDRAGGIAFGMKNVSNYFVLRINALEDNVVLFEYVNSKRIERASATRKIASGAWHTLRTEISGSSIKGYFDEEQVIEYSSDKPIIGFIGLWTKADSVTCFDELTMQAHDRNRIIEF